MNSHLGGILKNLSFVISLFLLSFAAVASDCTQYGGKFTTGYPDGPGFYITQSGCNEIETDYFSIGGASNLDLSIPLDGVARKVSYQGVGDFMVTGFWASANSGEPVNFCYGRSKGPQTAIVFKTTSATNSNDPGVYECLLLGGVHGNSDILDIYKIYMNNPGLQGPIYYKHYPSK